MAPALVQSAKFDRGFTGSTTAPVAFPGALTSGTILIAMATIGASTTVTFSDTVNTWTTVTSRYWGNVGETIAIGWAQNTSTSALTVTATFGSSAAFGSIIISEFSGVATSTPVDVFTAGTNAAATTTPTDVSMTTTVDGDLIISAIASDGGTVSAGSGNTLIQANTVTTLGGLEYRVQTTAGAIAMGWTLSTSAQSIPISVAFKAAGGAAAASFPFRRNPARGLILRGRR